jgi:hypothetical protein
MLVSLEKINCSGRTNKGVNLISFSLAEVFVGHKQLRLPGQEASNAKHPQPPNHQLFKVALRP